MSHLTLDTLPPDVWHSLNSKRCPGHACEACCWRSLDIYTKCAFGSMTDDTCSPCRDSGAACHWISAWELYCKSLPVQQQSVVEADWIASNQSWADDRVEMNCSQHDPQSSRSSRYDGLYVQSECKPGLGASHSPPNGVSGVTDRIPSSQGSDQIHSVDSLVRGSHEGTSTTRSLGASQRPKKRCKSKRGRRRSPAARSHRAPSTVVERVSHWNPNLPSSRLRKSCVRCSVAPFKDCEMKNKPQRSSACTRCSEDNFPCTFADDFKHDDARYLYPRGKLEREIRDKCHDVILNWKELELLRPKRLESGMSPASSVMISGTCEASLLTSFGRRVHASKYRTWSHDPVRWPTKLSACRCCPISNTTF